MREAIDIRTNPKRDKLQEILDRSANTDDGSVGVLSVLAAGRTPGWPPERADVLACLSDRAIAIRSEKEMSSSLFAKVVLPCACRNAPSALLSAVLYAGVTSSIDALVYDGEKFSVPQRLQFPTDAVFASKLQHTKVDHEVADAPGETVLSAVDTWMNEAFWQGVHGGARTESAEYVRANYLLFSDGTGTFLPANGRVLTLPASGLLSAESDLCRVRVEDVGEGDVIVLRSGESGFLLDKTSNRLMTSEGIENSLETATDWKESLEALLVTHSCEEVAAALKERGVACSAASVHQWVGPEVLGPGDEQVFRKLLYLLLEKGKLR